MKIVLFGDGGTVGKAVRSALEATHEVVGVSRNAGAFQADIREIESLKDVYRKIGSFDHVASAAGEVFPAPLEETTDEQWANSFASKAMGQINIFRAGIPPHQRQGFVHSYFGDSDRRSCSRNHGWNYDQSHR